MDYSKLKYEKIWESSSKGNPLYARLFDSGNNESFIIEVKNPDQYAPTLFMETDKNTKFKSFNHGKNLEPIAMFGRQDLKKIINSNRKEREDAKLAGIKTPEIYGDVNVNYEFIRKNWPDTLSCDHEFRVLWLDIETRSGGEEDGVPKSTAFPKAELAEYTVTTIQMYDSQFKEFIILGLKEWKCSYKSELGNVRYISFDNEYNMMKTFLQLWKKLNPTAVCGYNSNMFDLPYLYNRLNNLGLPGNELSPIGIVKDSKYDWKTKQEVPLIKETEDGIKYPGIDIEGLYMMDYKDLVLKYAFLGLPNYGLGDVAEAYGIEGKHKRKSFEYMDFDSSYTAKNIQILIKDRNKVPEDELEIWDILNSGDKEAIKKIIFEEFMTYSIRDVEVMIEMDLKAKLLGIAKTIAYICGVNVDDVSGTLKQWQNYIFNDGYKNNIILSVHQQDSDDKAIYKAGFTCSRPGLHKYIISVDAASMYPNIFQACNVGADSIISEEDLPEELKLLKEKYFNFFTWKNFGKGGIFDLKYKGEMNDIIEEKEFFWNILNNNEIGETCKKYNVSVTPNGCFYKNDTECTVARAMRENIGMRYKAKYSGIKLSGDLEKIKAEMIRRGIKY